MFEKFAAMRSVLVYNHNYPPFLRSIVNFFKGGAKILLFFNVFFYLTGLNYSFVISGSMTPTERTNELQVASCNLSQLATWGFVYPIADNHHLEDFSPMLHKMIKPLDKLLDVSWLNSNKYQPGDVIILYSDFHPEMIFNKRFIAQGGQKVMLSNGVVIVDGKVCKLEYLGAYRGIENNKEIFGEIYEETFANGHKHKILMIDNFGSGSYDNTEEFVVPAKHTFMMGDNRQDSLDSRGLIGFIEARRVFGRIGFTCFSHGNLHTLNFEWLKSIRIRDSLRKVT